MNRIYKTLFISALAIGFLGGCGYYVPSTGTAYWQRVEAQSALYLTGPKAQQQLEQNIATCTAEIDELVRLRALRETTPPDTHHAYHGALAKSGDLAAFETPEHYRDLHVDHSDYYNFESCMRSKGWERVQSVRYAADAKAWKTYHDTKDLRAYGVTGHAADAIRTREKREIRERRTSYND